MHHPKVRVHWCEASGYCQCTSHNYAMHAHMCLQAVSLAMQCKARGETITTDIDRIFNKLVKRPRGG